MRTELSIRPAVASDALAIAELYAAARAAARPSMPPVVHTPEEDRAWFAARLADGDREGWVAERSGNLLGFALATPTWLNDLYVLPDAQGNGVGTALLDLVKAQRPDGFGLWVFASNAPARTFYARHGFVELEHTDGSANEEKAPDIKLVWPGRDPLACFRTMIDEVDLLLGDVLARRAALTRAVQAIKTSGSRDPEREADIARRVAAVAPELGEERVARIVDVIITESLGAVGDSGALGR